MTLCDAIYGDYFYTQLLNQRLHPLPKTLLKFFGLIFSNTLLNVSGLGFRMVVLETSTTFFFIESILFNIFPTLCPCQNRNSDDIGK